jgi:hypothetical protein
MENAIIDLLKNISYKEDEMPHFSKEGYTPIKLAKENFHDIRKKESSKKIAFIDGGNQEIVGAHNFSLQMIRVYYTIYQGNKRTEKGTNEAFVLISALKKDKSLLYDVKIFSKDKTFNIKNLSFDAYDTTLSVGQRMVKVESVGDVARKFLEIATAKTLCKSLSGGFILLDTTLEVTVNGEKKYFDELYEEAGKNNVAVAALSKTTALLTESGNSVLAILNFMKTNNEWYYYPLVKINNPEHNAEVYLVKLNNNSKHIFRLEINKDSKDRIDELLSLLMENSTDPVFPGYPYGLIEADKFARVTNREIDVKRTQLFMKIGKDFEKLKNHLNTKNAHNILDSIG